jgi:hypothetical protein|tara:strand:+ start:374 stop:622 length:249 start_codon:yes stop_codon:yes gene_type:complete
MDRTFDKLISALVMEVSAEMGHPQGVPISKRCRAIMELRIKGFLADHMGICRPDAVLAGNSLQHDYAKQSMDGHGDTWVAGS